MAISHFDHFYHAPELKNFSRFAWINFMKSYFPTFNEKEVEEEINCDGIWMPVWKNSSFCPIKMSAKYTFNIEGINCGKFAYYEIVLAVSKKKLAHKMYFHNYLRLLRSSLLKRNHDVAELVQFVESNQYVENNFDEDNSYSGKHILQRLDERLGICASLRDVANINALIQDKKTKREFVGVKRDIYTVSYKRNTFIVAYDKPAKTICTAMPHEWLSRVCATSAVYDAYGIYFGRKAA